MTPTSIKSERGVIEKVIQQEAEEQARQLEGMRGRFDELMTIACSEAIEYLESGDFLSRIPPQDVISILKVHLEVVERQGGFNPPHQDTEWTEDELAEIDHFLEEIDAEEGQVRPEERASCQFCLICSFSSSFGP